MEGSCRFKNMLMLHFYYPICWGYRRKNIGKFCYSILKNLTWKKILFNLNISYKSIEQCLGKRENIGKKILGITFVMHKENSYISRIISSTIVKKYWAPKRENFVRVPTVTINLFKKSNRRNETSKKMEANSVLQVHKHHKH